MASLFSPLWYRCAEQHPRLRAEVHAQRQQVRGQRWYLLVNAASGRQLRLNHSAYEFVGRCDGRRSVQQVWDDLLEHLRDDAPTQDEVIATLNELDDHDLLVYENAPDAVTMVRRRDRRAQRRSQGFVNPFALRVPLGDPGALLSRLDPLAKLIFNPAMLWIWLGVVAAAALSAGSNWSALSSHAAAYMGTPRYLLLAWLCFPFVKALHELGHGLAVRRWGGAVHEAGFSLFVLVPAPYVDASASAAFPLRGQRLAVCAAGIMVELALAAIALVVWLNVQPGLVRDVAFVTLFIASVSTLLFNGNPLLRFDAYYILQDALDLPNLDTRSKAWWAAVVRRALEPQSAPARMQLASGELKWLVAFGPLSVAYRIAISWLLVMWLGGYSSLLAAAAALALGIGIVAKPALSTLAQTWAAAPAGRARWRLGAMLAGAAAVAAIGVCAVPVPFHTIASGVVWLPEQARVRLATDGFVSEVLVRDGDRVTAGQTLVVLADPALLTERGRLVSRLEQLHASRYGALTGSSEEARSTEESIARVHGELQAVEERIGHLQVRARAEGTLVMPHHDDLPGTFLRKGSTLAHVLERSDIGIRAAVPEFDAALVRDHTRKVNVRIAGAAGPVAAALVREVPAATHDLPSAALGDRGGGPHATDPADKDGLRAREPVVLIDLSLPSTELERVGARASVRFDHGAQPLAQRWYRQSRQVLLRHFNRAG